MTIASISDRPRFRWLLKGCPRCRGDLFVDLLESPGRDLMTMVCLQCGFRGGTAGYVWQPLLRYAPRLLRQGY